MPKFDEKKQYSWNPSDTFNMTGQEFASFYHLLTNEMNVVGGATIGLKVEAYGVMMRIFVAAVESGKIYEQKEDAPEALKASEDAAVKNLFN